MKALNLIGGLVSPSATVSQSPPPPTVVLFLLADVLDRFNESSGGFNDFAKVMG